MLLLMMMLTAMVTGGSQMYQTTKHSGPPPCLTRSCHRRSRFKLHPGSPAVKGAGGALAGHVPATTAWAPELLSHPCP